MKYRNKKTIVGGLMFDSRAEHARYNELIIMERAGAIGDLMLQHEFMLIPKQAGERSVKYRADFVYNENGEFIVEDVKSKITAKNPVYILKRKLMLERHGIRIREIIR